MCLQVYVYFFGRSVKLKVFELTYNNPKYGIELITSSQKFQINYLTPSNIPDLGRALKMSGINRVKIIKHEKKQHIE